MRDQPQESTPASPLLVVGARPGHVTPVDRGARRDRAIVLSTTVGVAARSITPVLNLLVLPLMIGYLGLERYGILATLTAIGSMLMFADLGLGNGLLNAVSEANGRGDRRGAAVAISNATALLGLVALLFGASFFLVSRSLDWGLLFHLKVATPEEAAGAAAVTFAAFCVGLPLAVVDKVRLGYQEGFTNGIASLGAALLSLVALLLAINAGFGLVVIVVALVLPALAATLANGVALFGFTRPWARPRLSLLSRRAAAGLARVGPLFFLVQLALAVTYQSSVAIVATLFGAETAAIYGVALRLALFPHAIVSVYLLMLWPAYGEALVRGDLLWVRRTLRRSLLVALSVAGLGSTAFVVAGGWLIRSWTHEAADPDPFLLIGIAIWVVVTSAFNTLAVLYQAGGSVKVVAVASCSMAIASVCLSVLAAEVGGPSAVAWGTVVASIAFFAVPLGLYLPQFLRRMEAHRSVTLPLQGPMGDLSPR